MCNCKFGIWLDCCESLVYFCIHCRLCQLYNLHIILAHWFCLWFFFSTLVLSCTHTLLLFPSCLAVLHYSPVVQACMHSTWYHYCHHFLKLQVLLLYPYYNSWSTCRWILSMLVHIRMKIPYFPAYTVGCMTFWRKMHYVLVCYEVGKSH